MVSMTPAIVSRCRVFQFEPLQTQDVLRVLQNALRDPERGYGGSDVRAEDGAFATSPACRAATCAPPWARWSWLADHGRGNRSRPAAPSSA